MTDGSLIIEFIGERHHLMPNDIFTFGRSGDLVIDDNPHLHRTLGRFHFDRGLWWLTNEGKHISLLLADNESRSSSVISPGSGVPITFASSVIRFRAGRSDYEIELETSCPVIDLGGCSAWDEDNTETVSLRDVPLTPDQRLLLVALGEQKLRNPHRPTEVAPNKEIADQLGWTITKLNRKLDNLCDKFTRKGVSGLRGGLDALATSRRVRLVDHVVDSGIITAADLPLLEV